jgi:predicted nucleic acid-binding protein
MRVQDAWIAATAKAHGAAVYTRDAGFDGIPGVHVVRL